MGYGFEIMGLFLCSQLCCVMSGFGESHLAVHSHHLTVDHESGPDPGFAQAEMLGVVLNGSVLFFDPKGVEPEPFQP